MRTTKPIATISFNTPNFLTGKLDELVKAGILEFWFAVPHKAEDDVDGKKDHFHVWTMPSKMIQTEDLRAELVEPVAGSDKPLGCLPWVSSKADDAILYFLHDKNYLAKKGLERKYHYSTTDVLTSDTDTFMSLYRQALENTGTRAYEQIVEACQRQMSFGEFLTLGIVPIQQVLSWKGAYEAIDKVINPDKYNDEDTPTDARKRH